MNSWIVLTIVTLTYIGMALGELPAECGGGLAAKRGLRLTFWEYTCARDKAIGGYTSCAAVA
jgi:hypothetical protein